MKKSITLVFISLILSNSMLSASPDIIANPNINKLHSPRLPAAIAINQKFVVGRDLKRDAKVYADRDFTYLNIPFYLEGSDYLITYNRDKFEKTDSFIRFKDPRELYVYVAFDSRLRPPSWVRDKGFIRTGETIDISIPDNKTQLKYNIHMKKFASGEVVLGGNLHIDENKNASMYLVIVNEDPPTKKIAFKYAPVHYQDTYSKKNYKQDLITRLDYDNNWDLSDNWENLGKWSPKAHVYYSVVDTETHYFILYLFYHPRDWSEDFFDEADEHENDVEGVLVFAEKREGAVQGMLTQAHGNIYTYYNPETSTRSSYGGRNKPIYFESHNGIERIKTAQEDQGHGCFAWGSGEGEVGDFNSSKPGQSGIVYYPDMEHSEFPNSGSNYNVKYTLIDLLAPRGLFEIQISELNKKSHDRKTFVSWGTLKGNENGGCGDGAYTCSSNAAQAPWGWGTGIDNGLFDGKGLIALDPARVVSHYFTGLGDYSFRYVSNLYIEKLIEKN